ncbi:MAG: HI0074 family nucleotidyltransferase substrate-binding subunit [Candidatus Thioglobus sp.]|uniref:HI0074 family nucleotidyltransferase substrate-binding subunit n=1 Tax=Candidatus Thioglobus sp. TaxID=2026721 RepID=UPI00260C689F|nr:HI0074 family nucleotidyltransferase substrate-binding subunit [Candidatus Thioglobus sp.]MDC9727560.1 HI0074 family nucleotidyltransferase substrate-binding subunit [Candidatus Thioglobus sp.]
MNEQLDLTNFKKAIKSLKKALDEYAKDTSNEFVRDSCIQRFEYCYDSSKKMLSRHLKNIGEDDIDGMPLADIIRLGAKKELLLHSWDKWVIYKDSRNATSHGYNESVAIEIVQQTPIFLAELEGFYEKLEAYYETEF